MTTSNTKNGITKDSTLQINVNPYLPNNYKQTLNYVGYWKWDSTNQTFIQVLNNQDIIDEKYNIKIQPLFYDADTGLPQKVTVNSGNTKRLKMVNDNNDGSMEPAEYIENNTMVRFNSKTRSVTEYPYFEVEALPPTILTPITSNGYYKFDGNNLIPGTNQDYNIYISISTGIPDYDITKIYFGFSTSYDGINNVTLIFDGENILISDGNVNDKHPYIIQNQYTIILDYGKPPLNSYYSTTIINGSDTRLMYNGEIILSSYAALYGPVSLYGNLINTPSLSN